MLSGRTVILNLEGMDLELAQRIIDFISGATFAISGNLQKISNYIFLVTPTNVDISGDLTGSSRRFHGNTECERTDIRFMICRSGNLEKDQIFWKSVLSNLSRNAYQRDIITYSDFLNLNEQNILHTLPKEQFVYKIFTFGGYGMAERQMAAFIPDALYLRCGKKELDPALIRYPFKALQVLPLNQNFQKISHIETIWDQFLIWVLTGQKPETFLLKIIQRFYLHMMILYLFYAVS